MPIDLQKSTRTAGIHLQKMGVDTSRLPPMRVGVINDISGSMKNEYIDGHVQNAMTHLLGLAMHLDPSQKLDAFTFDHRASQCREPITGANYQDYVRQFILNDPSIKKFGSTSYAPAIHMAYQHYYPQLTHLHSAHEATRHVEAMHSTHGGLFSRLFRRHHDDGQRITEAPNSPNYSGTDLLPTLMLFLTDGSPDDGHEARVAIHASAGLPIFWAFIGLAHESAFLREIARETDAEFVNLESIRVDDDQLFQSLISPKLSAWLSSFHT